jgi:ABC-type transporter Mla subunit MlaD
VLVLLIAVFLAYTANRGLPFVPTRELKVDIASGADLTVGSDVREGGFRIGLVSDMEPVQLPNGRTVAQLTLHLTPAHGRVPVNSSASIRPSSVLGFKYVDLHKGTSQQVIADGGTLPITQTQVPVQFDDIFQSFNAPTRRAIQQNLSGSKRAGAAARP